MAKSAVSGGLWIAEGAAGTDARMWDRFNCELALSQGESSLLHYYYIYAPKGWHSPASCVEACGPIFCRPLGPKRDDAHFYTPLVCSRVEIEVPSDAQNYHPHRNNNNYYKRK